MDLRLSLSKKYLSRIEPIINSKVFKNFSYLTIGSLISQLLGILTVIKITALFSPKDYGTYTFILSQGTFLFTIADLGITNIIIRSIARNRLLTNDLIFNGAIIRFFSVLSLSLVYACYNYFFGNLDLQQLLFVCLFALINCFAHLFEIAFLGNEKMLPISIINLCYSIVWISVVYILNSEYINVNFLFTTFLILNVVKALASLIVLRSKKLLTGKIRSFWHSSRDILKQSWPYFTLVLIMTPVNYLSNNFLALNSNIAEVGYFNLSQKLMLPVDLVMGFALSAIFPNLSSLWVKDKKRFNELVSVGVEYFILIALNLCFLFTLFARDIVILLFKPDYLPAVQVCQLQVWFVFLMGVNSLIGTILGAVNEEKLVLKLGVLNAVVSTPILYYASKYGAAGLSYGYVISFAITIMYIWTVFKKSLHIKIANDLLLWMLALCLFAISYFLLQNNSLVYKIIPALLVVGSITLYFSKTIKPALIK